MVERGLLEEVKQFYTSCYLPLVESMKSNSVSVEDNCFGGFGERAIQTEDDLFVCGIYQTIGFKEFLGWR